MDRYSILLFFFLDFLCCADIIFTDHSHTKKKAKGHNIEDDYIANNWSKQTEHRHRLIGCLVPQVPYYTNIPGKNSSGYESHERKSAIRNKNRAYLVLFRSSNKVAPG